MKSYLFVLRKPLHSGACVQEMLDIILTVAAFDQPVSLLLLDDAVFHLKQGQQPAGVGMRDTAAMFKVLELYDVKAVYIEAESLHERGLAVQDLFLPVRPVGRAGIAALIATFDVVFAG